MKISENVLKQIVTEAVETYLMEIGTETLMRGIQASTKRDENNREMTKQQLNKVVTQYMQEYINSSISFKLQFEHNKTKIVNLKIINFNIDIETLNHVYFLTLNLIDDNENKGQIFITITPNTPNTNNMNFKYGNYEFGSLFREASPYNYNEYLKAETNKEGAQLLRSIARQINNIITQTQGHNYEPQNMGKKLYGYSMSDF